MASRIGKRSRELPFPDKASLGDRSTRQEPGTLQLDPFLIVGFLACFLLLFTWRLGSSPLRLSLHQRRERNFRRSRTAPPGGARTDDVIDDLTVAGAREFPRTELPRGMFFPQFRGAAPRGLTRAKNHRIVSTPSHSNRRTPFAKTRHALRVRGQISHAASRSTRQGRPREGFWDTYSEATKQLT